MDFNRLEQIASSLQVLLEQKKATLAVAESLTGGLVSHLLTLRPGASRVFLGSLVCYSSAIKVEHLGIPQSLLEKEGVVSESVARLMAHNIRTKWGSDYALSLTGLAGPDKEKGDPPIGTVFVGFSGPHGDEIKKFSFKDLKTEGPEPSIEVRYAIQQQSAFFALDFLKTCIVKKQKYQTKSG